MSILEFIASQPNGLCSLSQLRAQFPNFRLENLLTKLYAVGYIVPVGDSAYRITNAGLDALASSQRHVQRRAQRKRAEEHQAAQHEKDKKKQFRRDLFVACIGTITGAVLSYLFDHIAELIAFINELFGD